MATLDEIHQELDGQLDQKKLMFLWGLLKTILDRGAGYHLRKIPAIRLDQGGVDIFYERSEPPGSSVRSGYTRTVVKTNPRTSKLPITPKAMFRDVETPIFGMTFNSKFFKQRRVRLRGNMKKLARDLITSLFLGSGQGDNWNGHSYYLTGFAGHHKPGGVVTYPNDSGSIVWPKVPQKMICTTDGKVDGTAKVLDADILNELNLMGGGEAFPYYAVNKLTFLAIEHLLDALPGNTAQYMKKTVMGLETIEFKGRTYVWFDVLDRQLQSTKASVSSDGLTITIDAPEDDDVFERWIGFDDAMHGVKVTVYRAYTVNDEGQIVPSGTGSNTVEKTITTVTDWKTIVLNSALAEAFRDQNDIAIVVEPANRIQAIRPGEEDGVHFYYGDGEQGEDADAGEEYAYIAGFKHVTIGRAQSGGRWFLDQLDCMGNGGVSSPYALAQAQQFGIPASLLE